MNRDEIVANAIVKPYEKDLENERLKKIQELTGVELDIVSKQTIRNISKWALNGASDSEIASNLELSKEQFATICAICPTLVLIMQKSRELADIVITGSLFQTAIGGKMIKEQQVATVRDYENGRVVGEHKELIWVQKELPPNPLLLKFIAEHKLSEKFGGEIGVDSQVETIVNNLDEKSLIEIERNLKDEKK